MLPSVFDTCNPRPEILAGNLSLDLFAAKLRLVVEGKAPQVYQSPEVFFQNTFATDGLKTLMTEVFGRLTGKVVGSPVIRLETSFGGGKTHDEIALWHVAKKGRSLLYTRGRTPKRFVTWPLADRDTASCSFYNSR